LKIVAIVQARMSSRRLPGKVLLDMAGQPMLQYLMERMPCCRNIDGYVIATSAEPGDDPIEEFAERYGHPLFRGSLDDVAQRCVSAAESLNADAILRLSGDSPFLDQAVIDRGAELFRRGQWDVVTNVRPRTFPPGFSVEVVGVETLRKACVTMPEDEREHVIRALYSDPSISVRNFEHGRDLSGYRLTVDDAGEFVVAESILKSMCRPPVEYSMEDVVDLGRRIGRLSHTVN